jgi:hypothetical protein
MSIIIDGIKSIIWVLIILAVAYLAMNFFGYEVNKEYFNYTKGECEKKARECADSLIHKGIDNAGCSAKCIEPKLIIKKK